MSYVDGAIARIQDIIQSCTDVQIKNAPDYPVQDAGVLPISIAYLGGGVMDAPDATNSHFVTDINVDVHFARQSLRKTYQDMTKFVIEFARRLHGDPTLGGAVDTITFPVRWTPPQPTKWDAVNTQMVSFTIQVKGLETPITP